MKDEQRVKKELFDLAMQMHIFFLVHKKEVSMLTEFGASLPDNVQHAIESLEIHSENIAKSADSLIDLDAFERIEEESIDEENGSQWEN